MNAKQIEVHAYFKAQYPEALVLYHLPGAYAVLGDDIEKASKSITLTIKDGVGLFSDDISNIAALGNDGLEVQIITYRNEAGVLDYPDIARLKEEKEIDY